MRQTLLFLFSLLLLSTAVVTTQGQVYKRTDTIPAPPIGGFGNIVTGVDTDGDGKIEIIACGNNVVDRPEEMVPRIWKFELHGNQWDSVWGATADIPLQNTWPALAVGDLDGDGRKEVIWGPVNNLDAAANPNPARILVYEAAGAGSDDMGVSNGFGGWLPNAKTSLTDTAMHELRPCKFLVLDVDGDGKQEVVYNDRNASKDYHFGIVSVNTVPNDGNGSEVWTVEATGKNNAVLAGTGAKWDIAYLNDVLYVFRSDGRIFPVKRSGSTWTVLPAQTGFAGASTPFRGAMTVDIDKDGTKEIVVGQWIVYAPDTASVYVLRQQGDTLVSSKIASFRDLGAFRLNGSAFGDVDGDGKTDMVFGTRYDVNQKPNNAVYRLEYQSGSITDPNSYVTSTLDSLFFTKGGDVDIVDIGNLDGDAEQEIAYSSGYTRGSAEDSAMAIIILDTKFTIVGLSADHRLVPANHYLNQNYPNPFNPSTTIRFGLTEDAQVELLLYSVSGELVRTLIDSQFKKAGTYQYMLKANNLPSGTYIYKLNVGNNTLSKKLILLK